jgi:carbon storage regulator
MLYLARKEGESIIINNNIEMTVVEIRGRTVKIGFVFPPEASILRKELYDKIRQQNIAAATSDVDENAFEVEIDLGPQDEDKP